MYNFSFPNKKFLLQQLFNKRKKFKNRQGNDDVSSITGFSYSYEKL